MNYEINSLEIGILRHIQHLNRMPSLKLIHKKVNLLHRCSFEKFIETVELLARDGAIEVIFNANDKLEKITRVTQNGNYLVHMSTRRKLNVIRSGEKRSSNKSLTTTYINNFYAAIEGSNLAFGNNSNQKIKNSDNIEGMVTTIISLLETVVQEEDTPEQVQEKTMVVLDKLEAFQNQEVSLSSLKEILGEYIIGIAGFMTTPYIVLAVTRVGQILDTQ